MPAPRSITCFRNINHTIELPGVEICYHDNTEIVGSVVAVRVPEPVSIGGPRCAMWTLDS